ncbi:MAG TPA: FGGY family carbohydrate kinase, partial [Sediminibacterium sp.]|nr:FGGY family carbohydrate kinase [Sediminibacterium sp.]
MTNTVPVIAVFDIGKTYKKCLLFNDAYHLEWETQVKFSEISDDDGFPCDNLEALSAWVRETIRALLQMPRFRVEAINFAAYGASWVYIDALGQPVTPLYNYLKPYPAALQERFYHTYGGATTFSVRTASPVLGHLNSGLQLYWLKNEKPAAFKRIQFALHLPQYISYLVTGVPCADITSIGCHTGLWDFPAHRYHEWLEKERLMDVMAPLLTQREPVLLRFNGRSVYAGSGLHDSSAALVPYLRCFSEPFVLL